MSAAFWRHSSLPVLASSAMTLASSVVRKSLALVDRGAAIDDAAAHDARRFRRIFDLGLPDLLAGLDVDRHRGGVGGDVDDALVDDRLRLLAAVVGKTVVPHRNKVLGVVLVDLRERTEPLQIIAHAVIEDVRCIGRTLDQLIGGLSARTERSEHSKASGKRDAFHSFLPRNSCAPMLLTLRADNLPETGKRQYATQSDTCLDPDEDTLRGQNSRG